MGTLTHTIMAITFLIFCFLFLSVADSKDCKNCAFCKYMPNCWWCELGCWISSNCKLCPEGIKNCIRDGFCGKDCNVEGLPEKLEPYGEDCAETVETGSILS